MATVRDVVTWALLDANIIGEGDVPDGNQLDVGIDTLNQMLALWQVDNLNVYAQQETSFSPTGASSYTVGTGANVNMARPNRIDKLFWRSGNIDYPVTPLETFEQWEAIPDKTEAGEPQHWFYRTSYPTGTLYLYPQPSSGTVYLVTQVALPADVVAATTLTLPPEYVLPIRLNLYLLLAGVYGSPVKPALAQAAANSLRVMRRNNLRLGSLQVTGAQRSNIFAG